MDPPIRCSGTTRAPVPRRSGAPTGSWLLVLVEAQLQQLQPAVVVLPEEVLEARVEETHPHGHGPGRLRESQASRQRREERDIEVERDRRERSGHVAE